MSHVHLHISMHANSNKQNQNPRLGVQLSGKAFVYYIEDLGFKPEHLNRRKEASNFKNNKYSVQKNNTLELSRWFHGQKNS